MGRRVDLLVKEVRGVAGDGDVVRAGVFEPKHHALHLGQRVGLGAVEDERRAVGDLRVVEHDHGDVVLVAFGGRLFDDELHEVGGGQRPHAPEHAEYGLVHGFAPQMVSRG